AGVAVEPGVGSSELDEMLGLPLRGEGVDSALRAVLEVHGGAGHGDLARGDASDVHEIVDEPGEALELASHRAPGHLRRLLSATQALQDAEGRADHGKWVAELVGEHGHELILAHVAILDLRAEETVLDGPL